MTREQALKIIDSSDIIYADYEELEAFSMAIAALRQPEQKKGEWRYDDNLKIYRCSMCCHCSFLKYPYCMHCGAKMEEKV